MPKKLNSEHLHSHRPDPQNAFSFTLYRQEMKIDLIFCDNYK